jgi:hypothetical protein
MPFLSRLGEGRRTGPHRGLPGKGATLSYDPSEKTLQTVRAIRKLKPIKLAEIDAHPAKE